MGTKCISKTAESLPPCKFEDKPVAQTLDQLETLGRYSVIYEITRIETMLGQLCSNQEFIPVHC